MDSTFENQTGEISKKAGSAVRGFFTVLLTILATLVLIAYMLWTMAVNLVKKENITNIIKTIEVSSIQLDSVTVGDKVLSGMTIAEAIEKEIPEEILEKYELSNEKVSEILDSPELKDFLSEKVEACLDFVSGENDKIEITADEIVNIVSDNKDMIKDITGYTITDENITEMREELQKVDLPSVSTKDVVQMEQITKTYKIVSETLGWIILGVYLAFVFLILIINVGNLRGALRALGVKDEIAAVFGAIIFLSIRAIPNILYEMLNLPKNITLPLVGGMVSNFGIVVAAIAVAGVILLILSGVVGKKKKDIF